MLLAWRVGNACGIEGVMLLSWRVGNVCVMERVVLSASGEVMLVTWRW